LNYGDASSFMLTPVWRTVKAGGLELRATAYCGMFDVTGCHCTGYVKFYKQNNFRLTKDCFIDKTPVEVVIWFPVSCFAGGICVLLVVDLPWWSCWW